MEHDFSPVILACGTLESELHTAMQQLGCAYPVVWITSSLHNTPAKLHEALIEGLARCAGHSHILAAMGFCGGVFAQIETADATLILPRADDCISLLLGSSERRRVLNQEGIYYFTEGWMKGERTIMAEYQHAIQKYGPRRAKHVFDAMLRNYQKAAYLNTGISTGDWARKQTQEAASVLGLRYCELSGTLRYLRQLLSGPWEEKDFVVVPPHTRITSAMLTL